MAMLRLENICRSFGGLVALDDVTFNVDPGHIKGVIGPNGAGKTTLFHVISGLLSPNGGEVILQDRAITGLRPYQIARRGISRTFQNLSLFSNMTVLENVMVGRHRCSSCGVLAAALRIPRQRKEERAMRTAAEAQLDRVGLAEVANLPVGSLSFGQRRMVELARALATEPKLLLLDEPASGLNTHETDDLGDLIRRIRDSGITVLIVEHDMSLVMDVCDDIVVLHFGKTISEGNPQTVRNNPNVIAVYLGGEFQDAPG